MTFPAYSTNIDLSSFYLETRSPWYKTPWGQGFEKWIVKRFLMFIKLLQNTKQGWNGAAMGGRELKIRIRVTEM